MDIETDKIVGALYNTNLEKYFKFEFLLPRYTDDVRKNYRQNGYEPLFDIGEMDCELAIEVYRMFNKTENTSDDFPRYIIEVWGNGFLMEYYFANTILALNKVLKDCEPFIDIAIEKKRQYDNEN